MRMHLLKSQCQINAIQHACAKIEYDNLPSHYVCRAYLRHQRDFGSEVKLIQRVDINVVQTDLQALCTAASTKSQQRLGEHPSTIAYH